MSLLYLVRCAFIRVRSSAGKVLLPNHGADGACGGAAGDPVYGGVSELWIGEGLGAGAARPTPYMWMGAFAVVLYGFGSFGRVMHPDMGGIWWFWGRFDGFWAYSLGLIVISLSMAVMLSSLGRIGLVWAGKGDFLAKLATAGGGFARWPGTGICGGYPPAPLGALGVCGVS